MKKESSPSPLKGYKVFNSDLTCRGYQFEIGKEYKHEGAIKICSSGFHFCLQANDCFNYYDFDPKNVVCEVEALGEVQTHSEDSKACTNLLKIVRQLSWHEVLDVVNTGKDNTGRMNSGNSNSGNRNSGYRNSGDSNSGNRNSGNWNSGNRNSGDWNSGNSNSGNWNSGDRNSGDSNSGNRNSGNWNSGDWNSGDSNSGYRNSGAFCTDNNPVVWLFDKPTKIKVRDWENHRAVEIMWQHLNHNIWVDASIMTDKEKEAHPYYETTGGYLKSISLKEAWANMWGNLSEENKKVFTTLPNFCPDKFEQITGINTKKQ